MSNGKTHQITLTLTAEEAVALRSLLKKISDQLQGVISDEAGSGTRDDDLFVQVMNGKGELFEDCVQGVMKDDPGTTREEAEGRVKKLAAAFANTDLDDPKKVQELGFMIEGMKIGTAALQRHLDEGGADTIEERTRVMMDAAGVFETRVKKFFPAYSEPLRRALDEGDPAEPEEDR